MAIETREVPPITDETLKGMVQNASDARAGSLVSRINHASDRMAKITGTGASHIDMRRFTGVIGGVVGVTLAAGALPNPDLSVVISDGIGALGGAMSGDNLRFMSRRGDIKPNKFIRKIQNAEEISLDMLAGFFRKYHNVLTEEQIRDRVLGRNPSSQDSPIDPRYLVIDELSKRYREEHVIRAKTRKGINQARAREIAAVTAEVFKAQKIAQELRADPKLIRQEGIKRAADALSGVILVGTLAALINLAANETRGGLIGITDDLVMFLAFAISALVKQSESRSPMTEAYHSENFMPAGQDNQSLNRPSPNEGYHSNQSPRRPQNKR